MSACRQYGNYGFKTHDIIGVIQDFTPKDDNTWFYKATTDVLTKMGQKPRTELRMHGHWDHSSAPSD